MFAAQHIIVLCLKRHLPKCRIALLAGISLYVIYLYICSLAIGTNVNIFLKKAHKDDANKRLEDDAAQLSSKQTLSAEFDIPDAASRIKFIADTETRSVAVSMRLKAPEERATTKDRINWFVEQLKNTSHPNIAARAIWPGRAQDYGITNIREQSIDVLFCENNSLKPIVFEVVLKSDLGTRFKGARTFIQESEPLLLEFYEQAGQYLKEWVAPPPEVKTKNMDTLIDENSLDNLNSCNLSNHEAHVDKPPDVLVLDDLESGNIRL
jgi:hypothetical protein